MFLYAFLMLSGLVLGGKITSFSWENRNMGYYVVHNKYTPRFSPEVFAHELIERAKKEYELPGITLNLTFAGMNTVSFSPDATPGETHFYSTQLYKRMEFDMKLNSDAYITPETLYLSLLHEFGHVFGLDHPDRADDSVMGKPMIHKPDGGYIQEYKYHTLTQNDVIALYKHESLFRECI